MPIFDMSRLKRATSRYQYIAVTLEATAVLTAYPCRRHRRALGYHFRSAPMYQSISTAEASAQFNAVNPRNREARAQFNAVRSAP